MSLLIYSYYSNYNNYIIIKSKYFFYDERTNLMISNKNTYSNSFIKSSSNQSQIRALLGPTNTGKTHYAIKECLLIIHIFTPLRLLARENYDKAVLLVGKIKLH